MRRKLQAKLNSKKGFTLVELLVVVAIIAILVAVSIPLVTGALDRARVATDMANERAAKAAFLVEYMLNDTAYTDDSEWYYDAESGTIKSWNGSDAASTATPYGQCKEHKDGILHIKVDKDAENHMTMSWKTTGGDQKGDLHGLDSSVD